MDLTVREVEGVCVVDVEGRIDSTESATELGSTLNGCIEQGKVKIVVNLEKTRQMTVIGMLLMTLGVAVIGGSVYYKTQREAWENWLSGLRRRFGDWE